LLHGGEHFDCSAICCLAQGCQCLPVRTQRVCPALESQMPAHLSGFVTTGDNTLTPGWPAGDLTASWRGQHHAVPRAWTRTQSEFCLHPEMSSTALSTCSATARWQHRLRLSLF
jgi:hypothetical protein